MKFNPNIESLIDLAIQEDYISGDATSESIIDSKATGIGTIVSDEIGILAGFEIAAKVFLKIDPSLIISQFISDGSKLINGSEIASISGNLSSILIAERTALNFLRKLSGVATHTAKFVELISHTNAKIVDTRKTTPGYRNLEKYAVRMGGGHNHRQNLSDGILIKDNHIKILEGDGLNISDVILKAKANSSHTIKTEIEVENLDDLISAMNAGADIIMLDNMPVEMMKKAVELCEGKVITEASGGVNLSSVKAIAETGVNLISVGAITHSSPNLDLSLDVE
ncbi:MAG: nicotinate-nucleotide diphosphorylase (carboxylating) [Chloroflexi bacterium]|nr:nicotinate-nucleotide diphosphorylase (carboxylating) [Chloroflexota bacterium]|tara:strand:- start:14681 stop:15526 length:846 start_codon:yes stop_codon:yes gene_type:complete